MTQEEPIGSAAEEAAKLFAAVGDWAREHRPGTSTHAAGPGDGTGTGQGAGTGLGAGIAGLAGHAAAVVAELGRALEGHLDTGAAECSYCPVCRSVHALRAAGPDVRTHLSGAATSLLQAVTSLLETAPPAEDGPARAADGATADGPAGRRERTVEKIGLDDPGDWTSEEWTAEPAPERAQRDSGKDEH